MLSFAMGEDAKDNEKADDPAGAEAKTDAESTDAADSADSADSDKKASKEVIEQLNSGFDEVSAMVGEIGHKVTQAAGEGYEEAKAQWKKMEPTVKEKLATAKETLDDVSESAAKELKGLFGNLKTSLDSLRKKL